MSRILAVGVGRQLNHNAVPNGGRLLPGPQFFHGRPDSPRFPTEVDNRVHNLVAVLPGVLLDGHPKPSPTSSESSPEMSCNGLMPEKRTE